MYDDVLAMVLQMVVGGGEQQLARQNMVSRKYFDMGRRWKGGGTPSNTAAL